jgi:uncharacterized LabA/DUF88 family protein
METNERVCLFVDGSNFYHSVKRNNFPTRIDHYELAKLLVGERRLIRLYYYNSAFDENRDPEKAKGQQPFYESLDKTPYLELCLGRIVPRPDGSQAEKGVDVHMATDMVYYAAKDFYDTAIVVTEDQDFIPAIERVKDMGKHIELAMFVDGQRREMLRAADKSIVLNQVLKDAGQVFPNGFGATSVL